MKKAKFYSHFYLNYVFDWYPKITIRKLMWKDKYKTPRCEYPPYIEINFLWFGFYGVWGTDQYWEQWLWINKYNNGNINEAKNTWPWVNSETKQSTWKEY